MDNSLLLHGGTRRRSLPEQPFFGDLSLTCARVHEFCGVSRRSLALMLAARTKGPIFWIAPAWECEHLHAEGVQEFIEPGRLVFFSPVRAEDVLWTMEEALRAGIVALVIADIPRPPGLTQIRRLHLAAETGMAEAGQAPLGVILSGVVGGAPGVETRWGLAPAHRADRTAWHLTRQRARTAPPKEWRLLPGKDGLGVHDMPSADERAQNARAKPVPPSSEAAKPASTA